MLAITFAYQVCADVTIDVKKDADSRQTAGDEVGPRTDAGADR
jgi:hypothetical protein